MQFKHVTLDFDGPVAILKLDHQEVMNAVSMDMLGGLGEALDAIDDKREEVRCLVLTGEGRAFSSGQDLTEERLAGPDGKIDFGGRLDRDYNPLVLRLYNFPKVTIAALNGPAVGAAPAFRRPSACRRRRSRGRARGAR